MKYFLFFFTLLFSIAIQAQSASINGKITDVDGFPVDGVEIVLNNSNEVYYTDSEGNYTIEIPSGVYTITVSNFNFEEIRQEVIVEDLENKTLNFVLKEKSEHKINDITVVGNSNTNSENSLLKDVKKSEVIKQNIGSDELSRKGAGNAEQGLKKITGISFVQGRGIFVRGLEDRYNTLLINNLSVPSNNPFKKIIALDLLPTDIIGKLEIYKTFNTNLYGDFAGATLNVETAQYQKAITKINFGIEFNTQNSFKDFLYREDFHDVSGYFGGNSNQYTLPSVFGKKPAGISLYSQNALNAFKSGFNVDNGNSSLNTNYGITHAGKVNTNLKYFFTTNFSNEYNKIINGVDRIFNAGQGDYDNNFVLNQDTYITNWTSLAAINYNKNRIKINANALYLKSTESMVQDKVGYLNQFVDQNNTLIRLNQFQEANLFNGQFHGSYQLTDTDKHILNAGFSFTNTTLNQPDRNFIRGEKINEDEINTQYGENVNLLRQYLELDGNYHISTFLEYNLKLGKEENSTNRLSFGYNANVFNMEASYRFVYGRTPNAFPFITNINNFDQQIESDLLNGNLYFREESTEQYNNKLNQSINAGYVNGFFKLSEKLDMNVGLRTEAHTREIKYRQLGDPIDGAFRKIDITRLVFLPSLNLKYALNENTNLRFAASKTITQPVIMERFPLEYVNGDNTIELGNRNLKDSDNYNVDFKYELFPSKSELITLSAFAKYIENPIERGFLSSASSGGQVISYFNSKDAIIYGVEFESIIELSRISESLRPFTLGINASLLETEVNVNRETNQLENSDTRNLQGASPWLVNADLNYNFKLKNTLENTLSIVFNSFGERINAVGTQGLDHIYEKTFNQLDVIFSSKLNKSWDIKLQARNILNQNYTLELGENSILNIQETSRVLRQYKRGTNFSISATYTF